ncbi:MAG: hypothetical protein KDA55_01560 [Planctomycetales bacterium]|nr:hypothetical protein [Planctomycetales bacterium]
MHPTHRPEPFAVKGASIFCCLLITLGTLGLVMPYFVLDDPAWDQHFSQSGLVHSTRYGFAIEWGRLLVFIAFLYIGVVVGFCGSLTSLLGLGHPNDGSSGRMRIAFRGLILALAVVLSAYYVSACFDPSADGLPAQLVANGEANGVYGDLEPGESLALATYDERLASARRCYVWYALYSAIFWSAIVPIALGVPIYAFLQEDWKRVVVIRHVLTRVTRADDVESARRRFARFRLRLTKLSTRYVRVLVAIGATVAYELYIAAAVMSPEAQHGISIGLALVGVNAALIVAILYIYYDGWQTVRHRLIELGHDEDALGGKESPQAYLRFLLKYDYSAVVAAMLAFTPWRDQLAQLLKFLQGGG